MNKSAIKTFAINARRKLIDDVTFQAGLLGITEKEIASPLQQSTSDLQFFDIGTKKYAQVAGARIRQRNALAAAIREKAKEVDYGKAFRLVMEEVAYTWFNRLIAIRFMEVNDYLPDHVRVLPSENPNKLEPDIVTRPFDTDLSFAPQERDTVLTMKDENKLDELFRMLFIKQCNALRPMLPGLFEHTTEYAELLLSISFMDTDGVVYHLTRDIGESDFNVAQEGQVEIIGWLYQYYNTEPKSEAFAKGTVTKDEIPAVTQLFTPDWIVRYMVENSLGRLWLDGHPDAAEHLLPTQAEQDSFVAGNRDREDTKWHYYLEEAQQEPEVQAQLAQIRAEHSKLSPEDMRLIDPCMGSGHILVYAFDVFMQIYLSQGYTPRDAARSILQNNLFGADIDKRAYQLAYFAVMMKARQYNRRTLTEGISPNLVAVQRPGKISSGALKRLGDLEPLGKRLLDTFAEAEEFGSILNVEFTERELNALDARLDDLSEKALFANILDAAEMNECVFALEPMLKQARILGQKYHVTVTNPPYMAPTAKQKPFVEKNYPASKADLFAVFIEKCGQMLVPNGYQAMITMHSWMFLNSFEQFRSKIGFNSLVSLLHFGIKAFEEIGNDVVQTCAFVICQSPCARRKSQFCRLVDVKDYEQKAHAFFDRNLFNQQCVDRFSIIPGNAYAYWVPDAFIDNFRKGVAIDSMADFTGSQNITGNNEKYLRFHWEINSNNINTKYWVLYAKGGDFRRYYGNLDVVVDWRDSARAFYSSNKTSNLLNKQFWFREGITYSAVTSRGTGFRYLPPKCIFDKGGPAILVHSHLKYLLSLLNSKIAELYFQVLNPSINLQVKDIKALPVIISNEEVISALADQITDIAQLDCDAFETSVGFQKHPLICDAETTGSAFGFWQEQQKSAYQHAREIEDTANRLFAQIYNLPDVNFSLEDRDIPVHIADLKRDIKSLISYAVGCMFGRYSLDVDGLAYAGGEWDASKYITYLPDQDNCIPITDTPYFEDDIVSRFVTFVEVVYGEDTLEENLQFIADALGNKGDTSREVIRNYFLSDFFKDHEKIYQKRPIYWLFDSGKQNGFKALVYMHRWNADTIGNVRAEYLERMQKKLDSEQERMDAIIEGSSLARDITRAQKQKEKLRKQAKECADYAQKLSHLANYRLDIDLDDGVKVNYRKVQTDPYGKFFEILADSKDIMLKVKK